jgi:GATA-binding protein, other eukaryote
MNLDDFIVPTSVASPAGIMDAQNDQSGQQSVPQAQGIPINTRERPQIKIATGVPASSVPKSSMALNQTNEFDYVKRRVRKTSIDERRVCQPAHRLFYD